MNKQPKVSVIVPTRNRPGHLPEILRIYDSQTWEDKEILILDDSEQLDLNFKARIKGRPDVQYLYSKKPLSIGKKRNILAERSSGDLIAHFDDDDYYSATYLERLYEVLRSNDADLVKLAGWYTLHEKSGRLGFWDTTDWKSPHYIFCGTEDIRIKDSSFTDNGLRSFATGYGFSYLYKKSTWEENNFPDRDIGEDSIFFEELLAKKKRVHLAQDSEGICLHIIHAGNTSRCFPNHLLPAFFLPKTFGGYVESQNKREQRTAWSDGTPLVSICTLTHNRREFIQKLQNCIELQDYPLERIEWLILDDSTKYRHNLEIKSKTSLRIKYQRIKEKLTLGAKRNLAHRLCSGDCIVYMDDDDYYFPSRISHAVDTLKKSGKEIAGSTQLLIYFTHDETLWLSGPFGANHATAGTFAMTKRFAQEHYYKNEASCNEEKDFLANYTIPMAQLDPQKTMICISHQANTFDKKKMRANGETPRLRRLTSVQLIDAAKAHLA